MEAVLFLPGILGSILRSPDGEIWPPTPTEVLTGYRRIEALLRNDLIASGVIESVCIDVYGRVLTALRSFGYREREADRLLIPYAYDWRRDILSLADELDVALTELAQAHKDIEIKLVCHSMGGLVARACLENANASSRPWATALKLAVFLATPHEGAPVAFARAIGVGGASMGLSEADLRRLSAAPGYPAAYQLFPPERLEPIWDLEDSTPFRTRGLFDPMLVGSFNLNTEHLVAAAALQAVLDVRRKPAACRYFAVVSAAHETVTRFNRDLGAADPVKVKASGDGTVPILSAAALPIQTAFVEANHVGVTQKAVTHQILGMLLGRIPAGPVIAAVADTNRLSISISERIVGEGEPVEIIINAPQLDELGAVIRIRRGQNSGHLEAVDVVPISVKARGLSKVQLVAPELSVGRYELDLMIGEEVVDSEELLVSRNART